MEPLAECHEGLLCCLVGSLRAHCQAVLDEVCSNPLQQGNSQPLWFSVSSSFSTAGTGVGCWAGTGVGS